MGGGKGGRGRSGGNGKGDGKGKGKGSDKVSWQEESWDEWDGDEWAGDEWAGGDTQWQEPPAQHAPASPGGRARRQAAEQQSSSWASQWGECLLPRPLASQWRFACRVLQRRAPQERVHEPRDQILLGDHIFVQEEWDFVERHGIICSANSENDRGRRGEDPFWVVHCGQNDSRLQCSSLSQFSKGGDLFRVTYPHWVCQCFMPAASTMKPRIVDEFSLQADRPDAVAKRANTALRNGTWGPTWSEANDLEFCIQTKTGDSSPIEIHGRKTLASTLKWPIGCSIGGDCKPSVLFRVGASKSGDAGHAAPPGFHSPAVPQQRAPTSHPPAMSAPAPAVPQQWAPIGAPPPMPAQAFGQNDMYAGMGWNGDWQAQAQGMGNGGFNANAQEFVMPGGPPIGQPMMWDAQQTLYQ